MIETLNNSVAVRGVCSIVVSQKDDISQVSCKLLMLDSYCMDVCCVKLQNERSRHFQLYSQ